MKKLIAVVAAASAFSANVSANAEALLTIGNTSNYIVDYCSRALESDRVEIAKGTLSIVHNSFPDIYNNIVPSHKMRNTIHEAGYETEWSKCDLSWRVMKESLRILSN